MHIGYHEFTRMVPYMRKKHPVGVIRASCRSLQGPPRRAEGKGVTERAPGSRSSQSQGPCKPLCGQEGILTRCRGCAIICVLFSMVIARLLRSSNPIPLQGGPWQDGDQRAARSGSKHSEVNSLQSPGPSQTPLRRGGDGLRPP